MGRQVEEFNIKIIREDMFFVATITFKDGREELVTQGENIFNCYDMIADILKIRCEDDDVVEKEGEQ